jgi:hypothetical protein
MLVSTSKREIKADILTERARNKFPFIFGDIHALFLSSIKRKA